MSEKLLLDVNVLIALSFTDHVHHRLTTRWFADSNPQFATCPLTQSALVRFTLRSFPSAPSTAKRLLEELISMDAHEFWPDDLTVFEACRIAAARLQRFRQTTDAYLLGLALHHKSGFVTLDRRMLDIAPPRSQARKALVILD